jgi:hypothetical protein
MRFRATFLATVGLAAASGLAVGPALGLASPAMAGTIEVVSADGEYAKVHPRPAAAEEAAGGDFAATMDRVFGAGRWRQTSGYRTQAQENALRRQGAGTVAPGHTSRHSVGDPDAPGAYDAVVDRLSTAQAAAKLKQNAGGAFRVLAERAHGPQGAHLHVELVSLPARSAD